MDCVVHGVAKSLTRLSDFHFHILYRGKKWQPTLLFLPGESHGQSGLVGCSHGVTKSRT